MLVKIFIYIVAPSLLNTFENETIRYKGKEANCADRPILFQFELMYSSLFFFVVCHAEMKYKKVHCSGTDYTPLFKRRWFSSMCSHSILRTMTYDFTWDSFSLRAYTLARSYSLLRFILCPATLWIQIQKFWFWHGIWTLLPTFVA